MSSSCVRSNCVLVLLSLCGLLLMPAVSSAAQGDVLQGLKASTGAKFRAADVKPSWMNLTKFSVSFPASGNRDSFVMQGSFNLDVNSIDPSAADITWFVDGNSVEFSQSDWKRSGKTSKYTAKHTDGHAVTTAQITWWVGSTSRCNFTLTGSKLDFQSNLNDQWNYDDPSQDDSPHGRMLTVELTVNDVMDDSADLVMYRNGAAGRLYYVFWGDLFVDKMTVSRNTKAHHKDSATITGRYYIDIGDNIDLVSNPRDLPGVLITIAGVPYEIPEAVITGRGTSAAGTVVLNTGEKISFKWNALSGAITISARNLDLSVFDNPTTVEIDIEGATGCDCGVQVYLKANKAGTSYVY